MTTQTDIYTDDYGDIEDTDYTPATNVVYQRLPAYMRRADENGNPLLRWFASLTEQLGDVFALTDRIDYIAPSEGGDPGDTSDLVDPAAADLAWLPWLAQLVGVRLDTTLDETAQRDAILFASAGWQAGTKTAIAGAAKSALIGTRFVQVFDHSTESGIGAGGEWDVLIVTAAIETPDESLVLDAIVSKNAKPAGVVLHYLAFSSTWADIESAFPTWADRDGSWARLEEVGLP